MKRRRKHKKHKKKFVMKPWEKSRWFCPKCKRTSRKGGDCIACDTPMMPNKEVK